MAGLKPNGLRHQIRSILPTLTVTPWAILQCHPCTDGEFKGLFSPGWQWGTLLIRYGKRKVTRRRYRSGREPSRGCLRRAVVALAQRFGGPSSAGYPIHSCRPRRDPEGPPDAD